MLNNIFLQVGGGITVFKFRLILLDENLESKCFPQFDHDVSTGGRNKQ